MKISELPHRDPAWAYIELHDESLVAMPKFAIKELQELKEENSKLRCLALHAMRDLFDYKGHKLNYEGNEIWRKYCHKYIEYDEAYCKAKKELMEGK